ncbi:aldehyde dehydrogenase family protein [Sinomonas terrae]|uniref:Aldehyde dehydrogenase family protein n=1 Tax=Sinomonas terrae TaxID=2908838 RepID=A0ABS9U4T3_9MICC|nr:aldehyde dehydrogenase family protein [Sinomonas terrae]MCH6471696.1 aldehyde dehydrogenase family protein [Sinomonas terrae]
MSSALPARAAQSKPLTAPLPLVEAARSEAQASEGGRRRDPRTGGLLASVPFSDPDRAEAVLRTARQAWIEWRRSPQADRAAALRELAAAVDDAAEDLADLNARETGRIFADALAGIRAGAESLRRYAELSLLRSGPSLAGVVSGLDFTVFEPYGVVLGLTSWDDPVATACAVAGASLAAGNVAVLKPSERCLLVARRLGEVFESVTPPGVLSTVFGDAELAEALVRDRHIDAVVHVGGADTSESLAEAAYRAGARLVRVPAGNGAVIVDRGVDVEWAASCVAESAFQHAGQLRWSAGRIFVMDDVEEPFLGALAREAIAWGDPQRVGPLVDDQARRSVHDSVTASVDRGAIAVTGAGIPEGPGSYYPPTVLGACTPLLPVMREEVRGPVAAVMGVHSFEEALAEAAEPPSGPAATVLTRDIGHAQLAAAELPVAALTINGIASGSDAPNVPQAGMPAGFGPNLLDELSRPKAVHLEPPVTARARRH